jgi:hypothetical protein
MDAWLGKEYVEGNAELFEEMKEDVPGKLLMRERQTAA